MVGIERLQIDHAFFLAASRTPGNLRQQLERLFACPEVGSHQPEVGIDHALSEARPDEKAAAIERLRAQGKTVLLSTHIFSLVEKLCDRVGIIIDGKMAVEGALPEICGGKSLEDAFFDLYAAAKGGAV